MNSLTTSIDHSLEETNQKINLDHSMEEVHPTPQKTLSIASGAGHIQSRSLGFGSHDDPVEIDFDQRANFYISIDNQPTNKKEIRLSLTNALSMPEAQKIIINTNSRNSGELSRDTYEKYKEDGDFVSAKMIKKWNKHFGDPSIRDKTREKIDMMRKLGGLDQTNTRRDIPNARLGLCLLGGIEFDQELKMYALESLLAILKNDDFSKESAFLLVKLAIELLNLISREILQTVDLETEIKLTEIYKVLALSLYVHAGNEHFNGITKELKLELVKAATSIGKLNRTNNIKIEFNIECAREWLRWLKDDTQELVVLTKKAYNLIVAGGDVYCDEVEEGFKRLEKVIQFDDPRLPKFPWHWHNSLSLLKSLATNVKAIKAEESLDMESKEPANNQLLVITNLDNNAISNEKKHINNNSGNIVAKEYKKPKNITNADFKVTTLDYKEKSKKHNYPSTLIALLTVIHKKYKKLPWEFSYGAIETLFDIALNGQTAEIRMGAFKGISFRQKSSANITKTEAVILPGLAHFASCKQLSKKLRVNDMVHLELPTVFSQNQIIRECCVDHLIQLIQKSTDENIIRKAKRLLVDRAVLENHDPLRIRTESFLNDNGIEHDTPRKKEKKSLKGS